MSVRGLAADEGHVVLVAEKLGNLSLHEEMVGGSSEPGQQPLIRFWVAYFLFKMKQVPFLKFLEIHISCTEAIPRYIKKECCPITLFTGNMLRSWPPIFQSSMGIVSYYLSDLDGIPAQQPLIRDFLVLDTKEPEPGDVVITIFDSIHDHLEIPED